MYHNFFLFRITNVAAMELTTIAVLSAISLLFEVISDRVEVCTDSDKSICYK